VEIQWWLRSIESTERCLTNLLTYQLHTKTQAALPARVQTVAWQGYAWCRFRARKHYWRARNAALRHWNEWAQSTEVCK
jgi:hypothetical protein